jgi:hypothetical protein
MFTYQGLFQALELAMYANDAQASAVHVVMKPKGASLMRIHPFQSGIDNL